MWAPLVILSLFALALIAWAVVLIRNLLSNNTSGFQSSFYVILLLLTFVFSGMRAVVRRHRKKRKKQVTVATPSQQVVTPTHPVIIAPRANPATPGDARATLPIDQVRELMGPIPRSFDRGLESYLQIEPPPWLKKHPDPDLQLGYTWQTRIRAEGKVVWGAYVQANSNLFKPGPMDHGASVIFSEDPYFDSHPGELLEAAKELFSLKGTDQADPDSAAFARMLTIEMSRAMLLKVPSRYTCGRKAFHSTLMVPRKHLPKGYLSGNLFPIWIDPQGTGALLLVPAAYWPASLIASWSR